MKTAHRRIAWDKTEIIVSQVDDEDLRSSLTDADQKVLWLNVSV
jgi:hypothetical protein